MRPLPLLTLVPLTEAACTSMYMYMHAGAALTLSLRQQLPRAPHECGVQPGVLRRRHRRLEPPHIRPDHGVPQGGGHGPAVGGRRRA